MWPARSVNRGMLETLCSAGDAEVFAEPGPRPVRERRYEEVTFCTTSQFVLVHSWTNGDCPARALLGLLTLDFSVLQLALFQ